MNSDALSQKHKGKEKENMCRFQFEEKNSEFKSTFHSIMLEYFCLPVSSSKTTTKTKKQKQEEETQLFCCFFCTLSCGFEYLLPVNNVYIKQKGAIIWDMFLRL